MPQSQVRTDALSDDEFAKLIQSKVLDRVPFSFGINVDHNWTQTVNVSQFIDSVGKELATQINFEIPGFSREQSVFIPKNAWQMFKRDHFPQWLLNEFPVRYTEWPIIIANYLFPYNSTGDKINI